MRARLFLGLALICAVPAAFPAENSKSDADARVAITPRVAPRQKTLPPSSIRLDVKLVLIPVTVTDPFGAPVSGLPAEAFHLFENGAEQHIKYFATDDAPVSLGIVFDSSRSMEGRLDQSRAAVARFSRTAMPGDEFFVVEFNDRPRILCDFTRDTSQIEHMLTGLQARNWTSLLDAVYLAVQHMKRASNPRKALLILSDGGDNNSRYTEGEMKNVVREADVCIYSIGLGSGLSRRHVRLLRGLSEETGGRLYQVEKTSALPDAVEKISAAIRNQYLLGYVSDNPANDGLYRKVEVRLNQQSDAPRLRASWRTGYYAPAGE